MELPIIFNNRYQLNKKLGEGGLAEVYLAQDLALGRLVAVKLLRPEYTRDPAFLVRFHREAQSAASLNNSNVVSVYDFGQDHHRPYIVMEYVSGEDLRTVMDRGLLTIPQIVAYVIQICNGVGMAHRRRMVHGDLKPSNILISPENRVKVTDFGLARALGESAMDDGELVWGTPAYFAPEQAAGDRVMPATDVYAIGIILYEMLTGVVPFSGENDQEVARKQLYEHPSPMSKYTKRVPYTLEDIVKKALVKDPAMRYHSADQLKQALTQFQQSTASAYTTFQPQVQGYPPAKSFDWIGLILGVLAVIAIIGLIPLWLQIYRVYFETSPTIDVPTPLSTLAPGQIRVPVLIGFSEADTKGILEGVGLNMVVNGYKTHPTIEPFSVVEQSIPPGAVVNQGTTVYVILSRGQDLVEVPTVVGMQVVDAERKLREVGLLVNSVKVWSLEPLGTILEQDPGGNTLLKLQSEVTLQVSGGTRIAAGANFDNQILLSAYELPRILYTSDDIISLTLFWQALQPPKQDYEVLIQLTKPEGQIVAEYKSKPVSGSKPTLNWLVSQQILDAYQLIVPKSLSPGVYQLRLGLIEPERGVKLPIISPGTLKKISETLILQEIHVN
jgi:serine/threonine-protein kinase